MEMITIFVKMDDLSWKSLGHRFAGQALPQGSVPVRGVVMKSHSDYHKFQTVDLDFINEERKPLVDKIMAEAMISAYASGKNPCELTKDNVRFIGENCKQAFYLLVTGIQDDGSYLLVENGEFLPFVKELLAYQVDINLVNDGKTVLDLIEDRMDCYAIDEPHSLSFSSLCEISSALRKLGGKTAAELRN